MSDENDVIKFPKVKKLRPIDAAPDAEARLARVAQGLQELLDDIREGRTGSPVMDALTYTKRDG